MTPSLLTLLRELEAAAYAEGDEADAALERNSMDTAAYGKLCATCGVIRATTYLRTYMGLPRPSAPAPQTAGHVVPLGAGAALSTQETKP